MLPAGLQNFKHHVMHTFARCLGAIYTAASAGSNNLKLLLQLGHAFQQDRSDFVGLS